MSQLPQMLELVDENLTLKSNWPQLDLCAGWKIKAISNELVTERAQLLQAKLKNGKAWIRFAAVSDLVRLDDVAKRVLLRFHSALSQTGMQFTFGSFSPSGVEAAADAWAEKDSFGLGGWFRSNSGCFGFHSSGTLADLPPWWPSAATAQALIASLEVLAQTLLLHLSVSHTNIRRSSHNMIFHQLCDNQGGVFAINRWLSTTDSMSTPVELLATIASTHNVRLSVSHIAGSRNDLADRLSRINHPSSTGWPSEILEQHRITYDIQSFWKMVSSHHPSAS